nr:DUF2059 domain-containing protein [Thalassobius sp. Cn5-15]
MAALLIIIAGLPASAQVARGAQIDALFEALGMPEMLGMLRDEGVAYGDELAEQMLPGGSDPVWQAVVADLHNPDDLRALMRSGFEESFGDTDAAPLLDFFNSEAGKRIVGLELAARRAFMDDAVEEAAREQVRDIAAPFDDHLGAIDAFVEQNDLVEMNVTGALNSNYMFMRGLVQGGAFQMSEGDILADVWAQEEETRADSREWIYAFLTLAYQPLSVEEVQAYVALSGTKEGAAMNRALFAGFDNMYGAISLSLGVAIARQMQGQTL